MFGNLSLFEIAIIAGVALIILGPEKFPGHAKIAMRFIRDIRGYWEQAKRDITEELKPMRKELRELQRYKPEQYLDAFTGGDDDTNPDDPYGKGYPYGGETSGAEAKSKPANPPAASTENQDPPASRSEGTVWQREDSGNGSSSSEAGSTPAPSTGAKPTPLDPPD
jgi:sec-independent protein translocase protein TatB